MKTIQKYSGIMLLSIMCIAMIYASSAVAAEGAAAQNKAINSNRFQERVIAGESNQWQFQQRTRFQLKSNQSLDLDVSCDADSIGEKDFALELNTSTNLKLSIQMNASDLAKGLEDGKEVKTQTQNKYRFQHRFMIQLELNQTGTALQARLRINITAEGNTWAYLNEATNEFVPVDSTIEDGYLVADTEHFSVWAVITIDPSTTIDGYSVLGIISILGIGLLVIMKRKH